MSNKVTKTIAFIATLCFLCSSSLALAHTKSWGDTNDSLTTESQNFSGTKPELMMPDCHTQSDLLSGNSDCNMACELLCSMVGNVMIDLREVSIAQSLSVFNSANLLTNLSSQQQLVEKRPPKQIFSTS